MKGRPSAPVGEDWDRAVTYWKSLVSEPDAVFDDEVHMDAADIAPMVTWGVNLAQSVPVDGEVPGDPEDEASRVAF